MTKSRQIWSSRLCLAATVYLLDEADSTSYMYKSKMVWSIVSVPTFTGSFVHTWLAKIEKDRERERFKSPDSVYMVQIVFHGKEVSDNVSGINVIHRTHVNASLASRPKQ